MPPLKLDGSNGISGIDGTVNRPAVVGVATTTGLQFGTDEINFVTGGTNRVEVNASNAAVVTIPQDGNQLLLRQTDTDSGYLMGCNNTNGDLTFSRRALGSNTEEFRMLAGGGLTFNGDTAAANALDDYEEGTWTPTEKNSISITVSFAKYIKIGSFVMCEVDITYAANSNSNDTAITLPFAMGNASEYGNGISAWSENGDGVKMHVSSNFAFLMKIETASNFGNANLTGAAMSSNRFLATFTYRTAT